MREQMPSFAEREEMLVAYKSALIKGQKNHKLGIILLILTCTSVGSIEMLLSWLIGRPYSIYVCIGFSLIVVGTTTLNYLTDRQLEKKIAFLEKVRILP